MTIVRRVVTVRATILVAWQPLVMTTPLTGIALESIRIAHENLLFENQETRYRRLDTSYVARRGQRTNDDVIARELWKQRRVT